jgi:hypothetical protein
MPRRATGRKNGRPRLLTWRQRVGIALRVETLRTAAIKAAVNTLLEKKRPQVKRYREVEQAREQKLAEAVEREKRRAKAYPKSAPHPVRRGKLDVKKTRRPVASQPGRRRVLNGEAGAIDEKVARERGVTPRYVRRCCEEYRAWRKRQPPEPPYQPAPPGYPPGYPRR